MTRCGALAALAGLLLGACCPRAHVPPGEAKGVMAIDDVLRRHEAALMTLPHVVSLGLGERRGKGVILIFLDRDPGALGPEELRRYPAELEGHPVELRQVVKVGP